MPVQFVNYSSSLSLNSNTIILKFDGGSLDLMNNLTSVIIFKANVNLQGDLVVIDKTHIDFGIKNLNSYNNMEINITLCIDTSSPYIINSIAYIFNSTSSSIFTSNPTACDKGQFVNGNTY